MFKRLSQVVRFYVHKCPSRQKFFDILERNNSNTYFNDFDDNDPHYLWAKVAYYLNNTLKAETRERRQAFIRAELQDGAKLEAYESIAEDFGKHPKTIARWVREIKEELERIYVARGILEPDPYDKDYRKSYEAAASNP